MPLYEYKCDGCGHVFEELIFGNEQPACPRCEDTRLEKLISTFAVSVRHDPPPCSNGGCGMGPCENPGGPDACAFN